MRKTYALAALALGAALLLAACGDDELEPVTVTITGVDFAFEGVPDRVAAGSTLVLTNASDVELHEIVALHIPDDVDLSVGELLQLPEDELDALIPPGPPAAVIIAPPGEEGFAVLGDGTLTEPGRYALVCFVPIGADPAAFLAAGEDGDGPPDVPGGPPHFVEGMFAELTVE